jgi:monofunctional biosynthetic peptidoglycan transglycosylase
MRQRAGMPVASSGRRVKKQRPWPGRSRQRAPVRRILLTLVVALALLPTAVIAAYRVFDPPVTPLMLIRVFQGEGLEQRWVDLDAISPQLVRAVIAAEDGRFCRHFGFDVDAINEEINQLLEGERPRGASTITMQVAKNILLWPGRDPVRKAIEAVLTPQIELLWSKRRIVEVYLNILEMGNGLYGAEAASRRFFGKPARGLTAWESSLLAAILPNPRMRSVVRPSPGVERRARLIADRAAQTSIQVDCLR